MPLLVLLHFFGQHRAQGTSLIALVPPTGLLAFLAYYRAGAVDIRTGLLIIPGVFIGAILGSKIARGLAGGTDAARVCGDSVRSRGVGIFHAARALGSKVAPASLPASYEQNSATIEITRGRHSSTNSMFCQSMRRP